MTEKRVAATDPLALVECIAAVALGDRSAFRRLYEATSPKLFAVALRILREDSRAEDVLQDSFVNVWHGAGRYDANRAAPMTWLVAIVRNRALDEIRRADRAAVPLDSDMEAALESLAPGPSQRAALAEESVALGRCLDRLDGGQRQAIAFAYFQGFTHSELAGTLRVPIGTVKTWIRRGLEKLRRCLDEGAP